MFPSRHQRPAGRRRFRVLAILGAGLLMTVGLSAAVVQTQTEPAEASVVSFSQCNGRGAGPGGAPLAVTCSIDIVNTIGPTGHASSSTVLRVCALNACTGDTVNTSDVVNAVHQCNGSDNVGGSTTICSVNIVNNISASAPAAASALVLNQCVGSGGGEGTLMTGCIEHTSGGADVVQCNGSGTGGGGMMTCSASGTVSGSFPVAVDQCNGSENGGGSFVTCTVTMTTNVVDIDQEGEGGSGGGGTPGGGTGTPTGGIGGGSGSPFESGFTPEGGVPVLEAGPPTDVPLLPPIFTG